MAEPSIGFRNGDLVAKNITFDYTTNPQPAQPGVITQNAQLLIGSVIATPTIAMSAGNLVSPGGSIVFGYAHPNITADVAGGGAVITLTGDTGGAVPSTLGNINIVTANTTVLVAGNPATSTLTMDFGISNLLLGTDGAITTGGANNGFGLQALNATTAGGSNCAFGTGALLLNKVGGSNIAIGDNTLINFAPAGASNVITSNVCVGTNALNQLLTGLSNTCIGHTAGFSYTGSESSNILIANTGTVAESNTIRIGVNGSSRAQQNRAFMAGIYGVTVAASQPVAINSSGQLNTLGFGTAGQVLTSNGNGNSPTWQSEVIPGSTLNIFDDFLFTTDPSNSGLRICGQMPWCPLPSYPFTATAPANDANHPGVGSSIGINAGTNAIGLLGGAQMNNIVLGGGQLVVIWVFYIDVLSNSTNRYNLKFGCGDTSSLVTAQANGVYFEYSDNLNSGNWVLTTVDLTTVNQTNTSVPVVTGWNTLKIVVNPLATSIVFTINGADQAPVTTNIPTTDPITPLWKFTWVAGTMSAATIQIDLMSLQLVLTNPRF